jgi:hypothetical protein
VRSLIWVSSRDQFCVKQVICLLLCLLPRKICYYFYPSNRSLYEIVCVAFIPRASLYVPRATQDSINLDRVSKDRSGAAL